MFIELLVHVRQDNFTQIKKRVGLIPIVQEVRDTALENLLKIPKNQYIAIHRIKLMNIYNFPCASPHN